MNNQTVPEIEEKMTFWDYYQSISDISPRRKTRIAICETLGIAESSLFDKIRNGRFTPAEKIVIADILQQPVEILFPEP